jgi:DNA-binding response OmpR family regulator
LTSRDTPEDKLAGFAAGADDYQVKPCPLPELLARITAIHARAQTAQPTEKPVISDKNEGRTLPARLTVGDLTIDREQHRAWRDGEELELPPTCFTLLWELALASPAVVTRKAMEEALWGNDLPPGSDPLRSHLYKLRQALLEKNDNPLLHTVRGVGARLE